MASRLSSLLTQTGQLTLAELKRGFTAQVIKGGSLDTVLMEAGVVDEANMTGALSQATGFPPFCSEHLERCKPAWAKAMERDVALEMGVCPIGEEPLGLAVAVHERVSRGQLGMLAERQGRAILPYVATEFRLKQVQSQVYDIGLDRRFLSLLQTCGARPPRASHSVRGPVVVPCPNAASDESIVVYSGFRSAGMQDGERRLAAATENTLTGRRRPTSIVQTESPRGLSQEAASEAIGCAVDMEALLTTLVRGVHRLLAHVQLFTVSRQRLVGRLGVDDDQVRSLPAGHCASLTEDTVISRSVRLGNVYTGPVPSTDQSRQVLAELGLESASVVVVPVCVRRKCRCVLIGHGDGPVDVALRQPLSDLARLAAGTLVRLAGDRKISALHPTVRDRRGTNLATGPLGGTGVLAAGELLGIERQKQRRDTRAV